MSTATPTIRRHEAVHSTWLDATRDITVFTPPGYDPHEDRRYPLLILHDGQNLFDPERAYVAGQHWQVAETAQALVLSGRVEPLVIVGIDHGHGARLADFTPTKGGREAAGHAGRYARFVVDEVLPLVSREYAVRTDGPSLGLGGSSLGGLVTLVMAQMFPSEFGRLLVMSPSVWWDRRVILKRLRADPLPGSIKIWLDVGLKESSTTVRDARRLRDVVAETRGPEIALRYVEDPDGDHSEVSWARRFGRALEFLYGTDTGRAEGRGERAEGKGQRAKGD